MTLANGQIVYATDIEPVRRGVRLRRASYQSVPTGAATVITWDTEDEDNIDGSGSWWPGSGGTITIPAGMGGIIAITYNAVVDSLTGAGRCFGSINITSTITGTPTVFRHLFDNNEDRVTVNPTLPLADGDTITCDLFHSHGSNRNVLAWFCAYRIGI